MMVPTPNRYALVKGASEGEFLLNAFDYALLDAGVGDTNLVRMSSILPPGAIRTTVEEMNLPKGGLIPVAYGMITSDKPGTIISTAVSIAIPVDPSLPGVIMETEGEMPLAESEAKVRNMAEEAFKKRNRELKEIISIGAELTVKEVGGVFAAVVLWYE